MIGTFKMASLGIPTAAASIPDGVEITLHDQNLSEVDFDVEADLVGIGFFTPQAANAYAISERFRAKGVPTIAGGIHPTMMPEETGKHFDSVVVGEVEGLWEEILSDLAGGSIKPTYRKETLPPALDQPSPMRSLFRSSRYLRTGVVQIARGCTFPCGYCVIPTSYGKTLRFREIPEVIEDIRQMPYQNYYIADENILFSDRTNREYALQLLSALRDSGIRKVFYLAAYGHILRRADSTFLTLLREAGCLQIYLVLGQDAPLTRELRDDGILQAIRRCEEADIEIMASFTLGHDGDDPTVEPLILEFCEKAGLNLVEFTLMTPWPGTPQFKEMERNGRLLTRDWGKYNGSNVVYRPRGFQPEELTRLYLDLWKRFYRDIDDYEIQKRYIKAFSRHIIQRDNK
jgi:radical SAM superfamily enzyme YgiQ (UPF0313 family)